MYLGDLETLIKFGIENEIVDPNFKKVIQDNILEAVAEDIANSKWGNSVDEYLNWNVINDMTAMFQPCMGLIVFRIDPSKSNIHIQYNIKKHEVKLCDVDKVPLELRLEVQIIMTAIIGTCLALEV